MSQAHNPDQQSRIIKRTLCIGVGGTGRDILMQMRRLIIDRYGRLSGLPIISFVHIDTDQRAGDVTGLRTGSTYRGEEILFTPAERVVTSMSKQAIDELKGGLARRSTYETRSPYDHIGCWLSPHLLENVKAVEDGASGIRPVGRLAFFQNYRTIQDAIKVAADRTIGHEQILLDKGFDVETGLDIFVVGSLCGGTGSGMCLDIAYGIRNFFSYDNIKVFGYWVISPDLYGNAPGMGANVYAALKELNHYSASNTCFEATYDPQLAITTRETRPPYDYLYLVSNETLSKGYKIQSKRQLSNVIAHKILLDCCDELTASLKGQLDNFNNHLTRMDEHPRRNVQRYLTFGLAKIYFPDDLTVQVALNRVKQQFIDFWLNGQGQGEDPRILLERFLLNLGNTKSDINPFVSRLNSLAQDNNRTFSASINNWLKKIESNINILQKPNDLQQFIHQFPNDARAQFRKVQPGETDSTRGSWLSLAQQSGPTFAQQYKQDITQFLSELLKPANSDFCLGNARSWLEAMRTQLNKYQMELEDALQDLDRLYVSDDFEKKLNNTVQRLADIQQKRGFWELGIKKNNQQFQLEAQQEARNLRKVIQHNFDYILHQEALTIVRELMQYVQDLLTQASNFNARLKAISTTYKKQSGDLVDLHEVDLTGEALFMEADTDESYQVFLPKSERLSTLQAVSTRILEDSGSEGTLLHWLEQERFLDEQQLSEKLNTAVESHFGTLKSAVTQSVIQRFLQKYPFALAEKRIKQILRMAEPLLPLNLGDRYYNNDPQKDSQNIGLDQSDSPESRQFIGLLTKNLGLREAVLKPIQNQSEIVIVNERAAFPLRLINGLEQMRANYDRQCELNRALVHNDYRYTFSDIIPPDAREVESLQVAFYGCLALKILEDNGHRQGYGFQYEDGRKQHNYIILNYVWTEALEQLASSSDVSQYLQASFLEIMHHIKQKPQLWHNEYKQTFDDFWNRVETLPQDDPNYLDRITVVGQSATLDRPEKKGILTHIREIIESQIKEEQQTYLLGTSGNIKSIASSKEGVNEAPIAEEDNSPNI